MFAVDGIVGYGENTVTIFTAHLIIQSHIEPGFRMPQSPASAITSDAARGNDNDIV